jgi:hypothetical protein
MILCVWRPVLLVFSTTANCIVFFQFLFIFLSIPRQVCALLSCSYVFTVHVVLISVSLSQEEKKVNEDASTLTLGPGNLLDALHTVEYVALISLHQTFKAHGAFGMRR